ncbi:MAG: 7-cyano-7-deazaguanine synthase QueC [Gemmatimonadetes bacterium]|nr:7-cyano-7-deazaguanine synthase QueC [Gemmatimonadota bacterium]
MTDAATPGASGGRREAVLLLSGGLDSTTLLALATRDGWSVNALTFSYGQRHAVEVGRARDVAERYGVTRHAVVEIDFRAFGGSALTSDDIAVPKDRSASEMAEGVPDTYVPARNTIFLSYALAWAEVIGASDLFIGVNALDYSGYPDCRPAFIEAFEVLANRGTRAGAKNGVQHRVHAPLMAMRKHEIIALGASLGIDYSATLSCYDPDADGAACGRCDSCRIRADGFASAGIADPTRYSVQAERPAAAGQSSGVPDRTT